MLLWTAIVSGWLLGGALLVLLWNVRHAPVGFEDERGFAEGPEPQPAEAAAVLGALVTAGGPSRAGDDDGLGSYLDVEPWPLAGREPSAALAAKAATPRVPSVR